MKPVKEKVETWKLTKRERGALEGIITKREGYLHLLEDLGFLQMQNEKRKMEWWADFRKARGLVIDDIRISADFRTGIAKRLTFDEMLEETIKRREGER